VGRIGVFNAIRSYVNHGNRTNYSIYKIDIIMENVVDIILIDIMKITMILIVNVIIDMLIGSYMIKK
jgi:hypothetical protein